MEKESKARFEVTTREREDLIAKQREELVQSNAMLEKERQETIARLEALESEHSKSKLEADSLRQLNERLLKEYKKTTKEEETHNNEQANTIASLEDEIESLKRDGARFEKDILAGFVEQTSSANDFLRKRILHGARLWWA